MTFGISQTVVVTFEAGNYRIFLSSCPLRVVQFRDVRCAQLGSVSIIELSAVGQLGSVNIIELSAVGQFVSVSNI